MGGGASTFNILRSQQINEGRVTYNKTYATVQVIKDLANFLSNEKRNEVRTRCQELLRRLEQEKETTNNFYEGSTNELYRIQAYVTSMLMYVSNHMNLHDSENTSSESSI